MWDDGGCGRGTRPQWIGIDVTYIAIDLMRRRLETAFGSKAKFEIDGIPRNLGGAEALFKKKPFHFERWAVSLVHGQPCEKQVGDKG